VFAPAPTTGDPRLIERMVANLADNALSYNQAGGRVEMTTGIMDGQAGLRIVNTGHQVPADQVQRLLQPFQRLNPGRTGETDGLGLGLSIVAAIAKAHHAVVSAHPRPGGGLSIEVSFAAQAKRTAIERSQADSDR
jgi:signal transduction histidine kinase